MTGQRRVRVIARLRKGRPIKASLFEVERAMRGAGWSVERDVVKRKRTLRRRARDAAGSGVDLVIVVGGDGAIGQVATALTGSVVPLGIVPAGTGNLLARNLGIPLDRKRAIKTILGGMVRAIDVGRVHAGGKRRVFTVACGIGFDAEVMEKTSRAQKLRWGTLGYLANAAAHSGGFHAVRHVITLDRERVEVAAAQVFVANVGRMLPLLEPRPPIVPDDGLLDVVAVMAGGPLPALLAGWEALHQRSLGRSRGGHLFRARAREIRIETQPDRLVEIDGSPLARTPVDISVVPGGLRVLVRR